MKKIINICLCSLLLAVGSFMFLNNSSEKITVSNKIKGDSIQTTVDIGDAICITNEAEAKYYVEQASGGRTLKPVLTYMYGNKQAMNDDGTDPYYCDNENISIRTYDYCVFDGYYLDEKLTKPVNPTKVGDVLKPLNYIKDSNGCITSIEYITVLYAKCKDTTVTTTTTRPTTTTRVANSTTRPTSTITTTTPISKDDDPTENPETGDNIWIYVVAGMVLLIGCSLTVKKIVSK